MFEKVSRSLKYDLKKKFFGSTNTSYMDNNTDHFILLALHVQGKHFSNLQMNRGLTRSTNQLRIYRPYKLLISQKYWNMKNKLLHHTH